MSVFAGIESAERDLVVEDLIGRSRSWHHASASQIKRFRECPSAWMLESVLGFPRRETAATRAGKAMHAELEEYEKTGKPPGALASVGLAYLPTPPIDAELVEVPFAIRAPGLVPIVGKIDLVDPDRPSTLIDHKSTSSISKYGRSEDELRTDPQAILYAVATAPVFAALAGGPPPAPSAPYTTPERPGRDVEVYPGVELALDALEHLPDGIRFEHVYYQTSPLRGDRSAVTLSPEDIRAGWSRLEDTVRAMMRTATIAHVSEVPHSLEACGKYGGCQFRKLCAGLGRRTLGAASSFFTDPGFAGNSATLTEGSEPMGLMESLARRRAEQGATTTTAPAATHATAPAADPFAVGQKAIESMRSSAPPATPPATSDDDEEAELERKLAERRAAKEAALAQAARIAAEQRAEAEAAAARLEAERVARENEEIEHARREAERRATQAPETRAELDDEEAELERKIAERRAAKAAAAHPSINPPDGLPHGAPLPEIEVTGKESDPVLPKIPDVPVAFQGVRLRSIKKEGMIDLFGVLRGACAAKGLKPPADVAHLFAAPTAGLPEAKRTAIKYGVEVALALLQGKAIPSRDADDGDAAPASSVTSAAPAESTTPSSGTAASTPSEVLETPPPSGAAPRVLYVGCVPRRVAVVYLTELLAPVIAAAEAELGVQHYRIPQYKRGTDAVVARLSHALRTGEIVPPAALVVEPGLPLSAECLPELVAFYDQIVERMG